MKHLEGLIAATYTPLDNAGRLNLSQVGPLVEHLLHNQVNGLFVGGSTGEGMSLTSSERKELAREFIDATAGRVPVIVHVGHNSLTDAADLAQHAAESGADAISATCPSYYPIDSLETLVGCMAQVAAGAPDTPFYYYHIPVLTGVDLPMPGFLAEAAERIPNLVGIKFTKAAIEEFEQCVQFDDGRYDILWGYDELLFSALEVGARGAVGSTYNIAAPHYHRLLKAFASGNLTEAKRLQARAVEMIDAIAKHPFHPAMKQILAWQGINCGAARLPMPPLTPTDVKVLREQVDDVAFSLMSCCSQNEETST